MDRLYKRPMFRKGGSANSNGTGITSGLAPRQGYATNENNTVKQDDLSKIDISNMNLQQLKDLSQRMSYKAPPMQSNNSLNDFLINFGLDIASRSPEGNIFQTAAASAKEPFKNFQASKAAYKKEINDRSINKYNSESDMFKTLIGAQGDILGSEGGSQMFAKQANDAEIQNIMSSLFELQAQQSTDQALPDKDFAQQQAILMQRLQGYTGKNPAVTSLFGNKEQADIVIAGIQQDITNSEKIIKVMGPDGEMIEVVEGEYAGENPKYVGEETARRYVELYNQMVKDSIGLPQPKAEGGRIGYAMGGGADMMQEQITEVSETESMPKETAPTGDSLSYEELRSRLPKEISDDIVSILAESPQALIMFSEIQTQTDVDEFNMAYGVNLSLPSGA